MKKKLRIFWVLVLALVLLGRPLTFAEAESSDESYQSFDLSFMGIDMEEDRVDENTTLELSPLNEGFEDRQKAGNFESPLSINFSSPRIGVRSADNLPATYDLRKSKRVSPVRSQGQNGSCWAFATYGSMESVLASYGKFDFSEKHMRNTHDFDWGPNDGGNRDISTAYLASWKGPIREMDDPYDPVISFSPEGLVRSMEIDKVMYLPDVKSLADTKDVKRAIMDYGGVYTVVNSSKYYENKDNNSFYNAHGGPADHAVTIVGWDDNFSKYKFTSRPENNGAWICKNSWGTSYMDGGYYYVSYEDFHIGTSNAVYVAKNMDPNGRIYQYDPLGATRSVGYNKKGYMANIFKAQGGETLHQVGLYNVSMETYYKVYLVKNINKTSQLSDERIEVASGTLKYPGYYTIDIGEHTLDQGEQFALVVYMDSTFSNYKYPLPIEAAIKGYSSKATSNPGQSFVSPTGESWSDLADQVPNANACIKAITTTGKVPDKDDILPENPGYEENKEADNIEFNEGTSGFLRINNIGRLTAKVSPEEFKDTPVQIFTTDKDIVRVDKDGTIRPLKTGDANIFAEVLTSRGPIRLSFI